MNKMSLERKIECGMVGRIIEVDEAKKFLKELAGIPLSDLLWERPELYQNAVEKLGLKDGPEEEGPIPTYGEACRAFTQKNKKEAGSKALVKVLEAFSWWFLDKLGETMPDIEDDFPCVSAHPAGEKVKRERLEERIERAYQAAGEQKSKEMERIDNPYSRCNKKGYKIGEATAFLVDNINLKEYFEALALLTGKEADRELPLELFPEHSACENMTISEALDWNCLCDELLSERTYELLVVPFSKIQQSL